MPLLHAGQRFTMGGRRWRVAYVNESRAHCVSTERRLVQIRDRRTGAVRAFKAKMRDAIDISPNSFLEGLA